VELTDASRTLAAVLVFSLVTVETGGLYLLALHRGRTPATPFQLAFARAGHAHAGVLLVLSLVMLLFADAAGLEGTVGILARSAVPVAALLMSGGFFAASAGEGRTSPNDNLLVLVYVGGVSLAVGLIALGIGLLTAG
jgi:hypothetical protein